MKTGKILLQFNRFVADYLTYNRSEQRGIIILSLILLGVIITQGLIPSGTIEKSVDIKAFAAEVEMFEKSWKQAADSDSVARSNRFPARTFGYAGFGRDSTKRGSFPVKPKIMIELNMADTFDLQQLRGIGPGFARRIVTYRTKLRGFYQKNQLLEIFGMDSGRYNAIAASIYVNPDSVKPIDLNTITFKELLKHPYFPFPVTKNIMIYRQKHKVFRSPEEIRNIEGVTDSLFRRIVVYLRITP